MRRILALLPIVLLVGCGGSKPSATVTAPAPAAPVTVTSPVLPGPLFSMPTLEAAVLSSYNSTPPYSRQAVSVDCRLTGPRIASCKVYTTDSQVGGERVMISADGNTFHGVPTR